MAALSPELELEITRAATLLRAGGLVAFPTETVYGLGADASNPRAIARIFAAKGRPSDHPLIVHLPRREDLPQWARRVPALAEELAERFWPGALTLVLPRASRVPDAVTGGLETVALRMPAHPVALALLDAFGSGIAAPSANRFGGVSPTTAAHVLADLGNAVDLILDGGPCRVGVESTIVDVSGDEPAILRPGGVTREALQAATGLDFPLRHGGAVRAPGMLEVHYAPRARVVLCDAESLANKANELTALGLHVAFLGDPTQVVVPQQLSVVTIPAGADAFARGLYAGLREVDERGFDAVLVLEPDATGLGLAIGDRLRRASHR